MYRWEGFNRLLLEIIAAQIKLSIVDGKSTLGAIRTSQQRLNWKHRHTVIRSVSRMLEISSTSNVNNFHYKDYWGFGLWGSFWRETGPVFQK